MSGYWESTSILPHPQPHYITVPIQHESAFVSQWPPNYFSSPGTYHEMNIVSSQDVAMVKDSLSPVWMSPLSSIYPSLTSDDMSHSDSSSFSLSGVLDDVCSSPSGFSDILPTPPRTSCGLRRMQQSGFSWSPDITPTRRVPMKRRRLDDGDNCRQIKKQRRDYLCEFCNKTFGYYSTFSSHLRTHSGDRPYSCGSCKKTFTDRSTLIKHQRVHSGARPYRCDLCGACFTQSGNMLRHRRNVH